MVSYQANVAKLIDVCRDFGDKKSVKYLWTLTIEGKRKAIVSNQFDNVLTSTEPTGIRKLTTQVPISF